MNIERKFRSLFFILLLIFFQFNVNIGYDLVFQNDHSCDNGQSQLTASPNNYSLVNFLQRTPVHSSVISVNESCLLTCIQEWIAADLSVYQISQDVRVCSFDSFAQLYKFLKLSGILFPFHFFH